MIHYCLKSGTLGVKINVSYFGVTKFTITLNNKNIIKNIIEEFLEKQIL